ncbi:hypothetical protein PanWU01x14_002460, partial [Parasponia andersonii]
VAPPDLGSRRKHRARRCTGVVLSGSLTAVARATGRRFFGNHRTSRRPRPSARFWANREASSSREAILRPPARPTAGVSHFATFFIDARAEISVAESRFDVSKDRRPARGAPSPGPRTGTPARLFSSAQTAPGFVSRAGMAPDGRGGTGGRSVAGMPLASPPGRLNGFAGRSARKKENLTELFLEEQ